MESLRKSLVPPTAARVAPQNLANASLLRALNDDANVRSGIFKTL